MSYIEKEAALEFVLNNTPHINGETTMECVERAIKEMPTDVVEVRRGEWIKKHRHRGGFRTVIVTDSFGEKHTGRVDTRYECDDLYCSVCGKIAHDAFLNYCANCGAKMDGERREE